MTVAVEGFTSEERVLWMALWVPGLNGRRGLPVMLVGEPGTAKTSRCAQLASKGGLHFESVLSSIRQPHEFIGMPWLLPGDKPSMHYAPSPFAVRATERSPSVILYDEVSTCPQSVQAALLRLLFEGVCGEYTLDPGVRQILAMNDTEDAAGGYEIAPPLANRVGWLYWGAPSKDQFMTFLASPPSVGVVDKHRAFDIEQEVDAAWGEAFAQAVANVGGFLSKRPTLLHSMPKGDAVGASRVERAWPSPRTWEMATRAMAGAKVFGLDETDTHVALKAFVGDGAAIEYHAWVKEADLPDVKRFVDGEVQFAHTAARPDRTAAVLSGAISVITSGPEELKLPRATRLWQWIVDLPDDAVDLASPTAEALVQAKLTLRAGNGVGLKGAARFTMMFRAAELSR